MNLHKIFIAASFVFISFIATAQPNSRGNEPSSPTRQARMEKIKSAKIAYLTDKLQLSTEQAQKFWPLYNEYEVERQKTHKRPRLTKDANLTALTDQQLREGINEMHALRQNELNLEKQYVDKFLKVISVRQLATLYRSEKEFTRVLLKKLDNQRPGGSYGWR